MDDKLLTLLVALLGEKSRCCSSCEGQQTIQATMARFNESASTLSVDRLAQHQKDMLASESIRQKMLSQILIDSRATP